MNFICEILWSIVKHFRSRLTPRQVVRRNPGRPRFLVKFVFWFFLFFIFFVIILLIRWIS